MEREHLGIFEVKTRFSEIVDRILREGRGITVTRRGKPVVEITPCTPVGQARMTRAEALKALAELRAELPETTWDEIVETTTEGRDRCPST